MSPDTMRAWLADDEYAPPTVEDLAREDDEDDYDLWREA